MNTMRDTTSATNSLSTRFRPRFGSAPPTLLAPLALALTVPARGETRPPAIPVSDIGARAAANYQGDALGVTATPDGARLRCGFQQFEGHATPEGLCLESTKPGGGQLRLVAVAVGRGEAPAGSAQDAGAEGTSENSPAFQRWGRCVQVPSREATAELGPRFGSPFGTSSVAINDAGAVTSAPVMLNVIAPVPRRLVPGVNLLGQAGNPTGLDYRDNLGPSANWQTMATITLSNAPQYYFDVSEPLPPQRFYRAWQTGTPSVMPSLDLHLVPAITLTGFGHSVRVDYINQFGPTDAWVTLATVALTNTSQLYFDTSARGQPPRLYRLVQIP